MHLFKVIYVIQCHFFLFFFFLFVPWILYVYLSVALSYWIIKFIAFIFYSPDICMCWNAIDYILIFILTCFSIWHFTNILQTHNMFPQTHTHTHTHTILIQFCQCVCVWLKLILTTWFYTKGLHNLHALKIRNIDRAFDFHLQSTT